MAHSLPSPWPGAYAEPTVNTDQIGQGVIAGTSGGTIAQAYGTRLDEVLQVQKGLVWFNPSVAPLLRLITKLKNSKSVENSRYYHLEKQRLPRKVTGDAAAFVAAGTAQTPTELKVDDTSKIRVNDLLFNTTSQDISLVTAIVSATNISVTSNIGDDSYVAPSPSYSNSDVLYNIGNAYLDGSGAGTPLHIVEDEKTFYLQIFKDAIEFSDRYLKTELYQGDPWANARKQLEQEHMLNMEHAFFFGRPSVTRDPTTGKLTTTTGGLNHYLDVNRIDFNGDASTTKAFIDSVMIESMREGHSGFENKEMATKTMFASHKWLKVFNQFGDNANIYRVVEPSEKTFGLRLMQYQGSWGLLNVINAPVLNRPELSEFAFVLDLEHLRRANFKGRDTKYDDNIQLPDADSRKAQYLSDCGLCVELTPAHTVFENLG